MDATHHPMLWRIRRLARERGWTLARLGRRARVRPQNLVRWARSWPVVSPVVTGRVARALGVDVGALGAALDAEPLDAHAAVLDVLRGGGDAAAQVAAMEALDPGWDVLRTVERHWRAIPAVRAWARRTMARIVARETEA
jgi:hypothetical protein